MRQALKSSYMLEISSSRKGGTVLVRQNSDSLYARHTLADIFINPQPVTLLGYLLGIQPSLEAHAPLAKV